MESIAPPIEHVPGTDAHAYHVLETQRMRLQDLRAQYGGVIEAEITRLTAEMDAIRARNLEPYRSSKSLLLLPKAYAMHFLSLVAASRGKRDFVTDGRVDLAGSAAAYAQTALLRTRQRHGAASDAIVSHFVPEGLDEMPLDQLATLRETLMLDRVKFQIEVQGLIAGLDKISTEADLDVFKARAVALAEEKVEATRKIYAKERLDTIMASVTVSLTPPALSGFAASALGIGLSAPVGIAAALGVFAATRWLSWRDARDRADTASWSYLDKVARL